MRSLQFTLLILTERSRPDEVRPFTQSLYEITSILSAFVKMVDNVVYLSQHFPGEKSTLIIFCPWKHVSFRWGEVMNPDEDIDY